MANFQVLLLFIVLIGFVASAPQLDSDGQELLSGKDTRYYGFPFFWFGRPFYDDDDGYNANGGQENKRSSTISYAHVGGGWGR